ncbi:hypothetical protein FQN51_008929 [Onygenales sp. PD_10]|nr:hypothetical protein FQN51_008929 [Onygenales sp. PD_10]
MGYLSSLLPSGRVSFHHAAKPLLLARKPSSSSSSSPSPPADPEYISLADLCISSTPTKCQLNPLLFNGHLQTAYTVIKNDDVPIHYKRWTFTANSPNYSGSFDVDFVVDPSTKPNNEDENDNTDLPPRTSFFTPAEFAALPSATDTKPMLVVLHGLSGGSHEPYLRHVLAPLVEQGWAACVVNFRGCAKSKVTSSILYNARATWDVRQLVGWLRERFPARRLFGIGFSLGANILTNYLGEEGADCQLEAGVICSSPWNLEASSLALQRSWIGREMYSRTMGTNMKRLFEQHVDKISQHPRVNVERVRNITYLHEFDRELQGPVWGYPTEGAYYRDASSTDSIFAIKVPFFVIQAEDDPISAKEALPYAEIRTTPYGVMCTTSWGGHLSWFEYGGTRWFTKPITTFLNKMATEIDFERPFRVEIEAGEGKDVREVEREAVEKSENEGPGPKPDFVPMRRKMEMPVVVYGGSKEERN